MEGARARSVSSADRHATALGRAVLAIASLTAGTIHLMVTPAHFDEWILAGVFLGGVAAFQLTWAPLLLTWARPGLMVPAILVNGAVIAIWATSRTIGFPGGSHGGHPEPVGLLDLTATVCQAVVVLGSVMLVLRGRNTAGPARG